MYLNNRSLGKNDTQYCIFALHRNAMFYKKNTVQQKIDQEKKPP